MLVQSPASTDPITAEIIRSSLIAITDEMKTNLMRTAYSAIIYEALDYTVGLFDEHGDTISIGLGLPMFIRGLSDAIKAKIEHYGYERIEPGDILLTNDAYIMGSHLNHMVFTVPIFHEGTIAGFASSMAHWQDVGGVLGGTTNDIYSEGLQLPIVKIFKRGVQDEELTDIIRTNVRMPELAMGDFRAQIAAIRTGEIRYGALLTRYGREAVDASIRSIADQSERLARAAVTSIPDGTYEAESYMDDDGIGSAPIPIKVRVIVAGDTMTVDLSDVSKQVPGYFNSGVTAGRSAAQVAFKCLTTPNAYPINEGAFRPLEIILPMGSVVSATKPSAMRWWMTIPMTVVETIFKALAPAIPDRVIAGHYADLCICVYYGIDPITGRFFVRGGNMPGGGWGAKHDSDGMSAVICINDGDTHNFVSEAVELKSPMIFEQYKLRQDSGGAGPIPRRARRRAARARALADEIQLVSRAHALRAVGVSTAARMRCRTKSRSNAPAVRSSRKPTANSTRCNSNRATWWSSNRAAAAATAIPYSVRVPPCAPTFAAAMSAKRPRSPITV